jgi:hypothetical protein
MVAPAPKQLEIAQRKVAVAMGACMALTWAPIVGGMLSGVVQWRLVRSLLLALGRPADSDSIEMLLWFFSKRTLYLNLVTYAPAVGPAVQAVLTYALGQLVIQCVTDDDFDPKDEQRLALRWDEIQEDIFSGERVIASYEHFSGKPFPERMKPQVIAVVDAMSGAYRRAERLPGVAESQHAVGGAIHRGTLTVARWMGKFRR